MTGEWILEIILYGARYEIMLVPYEIYPSRITCETWKARTSREIGLPLTCVQIEREV